MNPHDHRPERNEELWMPSRLSRIWRDVPPEAAGDPPANDRHDGDTASEPPNPLDDAVVAFESLRPAPPTPAMPTSTAHLDQFRRDQGRGTNRYEIVRELGAGGMGTVYAAYDRDLRRHVAIKRLRVKSTERKVAVRFIEEAQVSAQLEHPNIIPVYDLGVTDANELYISMKLVHGQSLGQILDNCFSAVKQRQKPPLTMFERVELFFKVLDAVEYAHDHGVIHRDLKPENIMVDRFNEVLVMDWGLSRILETRMMSQVPSRRVSSDRADNDADRTAPGAVVGTPGYMAIEQAKGEADKVGKPADIFALGAILYEIVTLTRPFRGRAEQRLMSLFQRSLEAPSVRIEQEFGSNMRVMRVPKALEQIVLRAMAFDVEERYRSVAEFRAALKGWYGSRIVSVQSSAIGDWLIEMVRRAPRRTMLMVLVLMLGVAVGIGLAVATLTKRGDPPIDRTELERLVDGERWAELKQRLGLPPKAPLPPTSNE